MLRVIIFVLLPSKIMSQSCPTCLYVKRRKSLTYSVLSDFWRRDRDKNTRYEGR